MTAQEILDELKPLGQDGYKKILMKHGVQEPVFGVKIELLKKIQKRIKQDYQLALDLYDTTVFDAMYLAGLIADDLKMTKKDLAHWVEKASCPTLSEYTVPWVTAEGKYGHELSLKWIEARQERIASSGWATLSNLMALKDDSELDLTELKQLLSRVGKTIHEQPNRVRSVMNGFVIAAGVSVKELTTLALKIGAEIGDVHVETEGTSCKVPYAPDSIQKVQQRGSIGKKKKTVKC